ncbi:MerC domain-containing protein [Thalassoglobus polymorphus]|uniref:MerC mercury resistance protein n=1 Tax=Thalassoglobus polymorphus TaxID=2527994 RepID=A0A517QUW2_9PLAN|nr:MerC domain-containing protein [Thalassoglobus polymorphus]QDT35403.1 MerC mercury resistance protein [Thalassoglobus polymorphus]
MSSAARTFSNLTGLVLSIACVIHCMLMPVVISSLPAWGLTWLARPVFHQVLALAGIAIGVWTLVPGWKQHRRHAVLVFGVLGLVVMNYVAFWGDDCCGGETHAGGAAGESCTQACCAIGADSSVRLETQNREVASADGLTSTHAASGASQWAWLFQHPTAWGAALLAWAHCFNGACTKACCQRRKGPSAEVATCDDVNSASDPVFIQLGDSTS